MNAFPPNNEMAVRLLIFLFTFGLMAFWELKSSRTALTGNKKDRWLNNIGLSFLSVVVVRVFFPAVGVTIAWFAQSHRLGLFNIWELPFSFAVFLSFINLDWILYYQHRALHFFPWLWKFHRVHHSDVDLDVATGVRFHFLENLFTLLMKSVVILILGCPPFAVFWFEVFQNATTLFSHSNVKLPPAWDKRLRWLLVTPEMHRVHHSAVPKETNSNFGFVFGWWDQLFKTYHAQPEAGYETMKIGLEIFRDPTDSALPHLLMQPLMDSEGNFAVKNFLSSSSAYSREPGR
jgi:sterol desaturase/sphingolipid hydroxylase (fatty acid hydroxylase superfamily)